MTNDVSSSNSVTSSSGGVNLDAERITIGGDVVGRDKITQTTITEEVAHNVEGLSNPYLGLMSFTYDERDIYAGRDDEIAEAVARLTAPGAKLALENPTTDQQAEIFNFKRTIIQGLVTRIEVYADKSITVNLELNDVTQPLEPENNSGADLPIVTVPP